MLILDNHYFNQTKLKHIKKSSYAIIAENFKLTKKK